MAEKKRIRFIRKRGRIIPIRIKDGQAQRGRKELGVGIGVATASAAAGGILQRSLKKSQDRIRKAARFSRRNIAGITKASQILPRGKAASRVLRSARTNLFRRRGVIGVTAVGTALGTLLAQSGAAKLEEGNDISTQFKQNVLGVGLSGAAAIIFGTISGGKKGAVRSIKGLLRRR